VPHPRCWSILSLLARSGNCQKEPKKAPTQTVSPTSPARCTRRRPRRAWLQQPCIAQRRRHGLSMINLQRACDPARGPSLQATTSLSFLPLLNDSCAVFNTVSRAAVADGCPFPVCVVVAVHFAVRLLASTHAPYQQRTHPSHSLKIAIATLDAAPPRRDDNRILLRILPQP
jgi:hypothetical protein